MQEHSSPPLASGLDSRARAALAVTLGLAWVNVALAGRWAAEPGALHGWRLTPYVASLAVTSIVAAMAWRPAPPPSAKEARIVALLGVASLAAALLVAFPPDSWNEVPFYDDWPGLLQLTLNGIEALRHGALVGWQWAFLGGYPTSADLSQSLAVPAWIPIALLGPMPGFHLFLAGITAAIPCAIAYDVAASDGRVRGALAGGMSAIVTAGYFATVMSSGMANSTAGGAAVALALASSHAARRGRRWGGAALVAALTLTLYSHAAFYIYGAACLAVEALFYRDWRGALRSAAALGIAFVAALPLHWELLRYPAWFVTNNLYFEPPAAFDWAGLARQVWYATEMLARPDRWFNDYGGLTYVVLPVLLFVAWKDRSRTGFYAWATVAIVVSLRFNAPQLGLVAGRQLHLLPVLVAPALAGFVGTWMGGGPVGRAALVATIALFVAVPYAKVPHVRDVSAFDAALVTRVAAAAGAMVVVENNPHWDMIGDPAVRTERSRFDVHFESLLPAATGKRFFGQPQDGYHRSRFRGMSLTGGGLAGRAIGEVPRDEFVALMRQWGVKHLFVWSGASRAYLERHPAFRPVWADGPWREFTLEDADARSVVTDAGSGHLEGLTPVGGRLVLHEVPAGTRVIVRAHYYPAWRATLNGQDVPLASHDGQMSFEYPIDGDGVVELHYDRRGWLAGAALAALFAGMMLLTRWPA